MKINVTIANDQGEVLDEVKIDASGYTENQASNKIRAALEMKFDLAEGDLNYNLGE